MRGEWTGGREKGAGAARACSRRLFSARRPPRPPPPPPPCSRVGAVGGAAGTVTSHPLDVVRIRQQSAAMGAAAVPATSTAREAVKPSASPPGSAATSALPRTSIWRSLVDMVRLEGPGSLLRGVSAPVVACALQNAVLFHCYGRLADSLGGDALPRFAGEEDGRFAQPAPARPCGLPPSDQLLHAGAAGFFAGCVQATIATPVELVKIRLQLSREPGVSDVAAIRHLFAAERARWEAARGGRGGHAGAPGARDPAPRSAAASSSGTSPSPCALASSPPTGGSASNTSVPLRVPVAPRAPVAIRLLPRCVYLTLFLFRGFGPTLVRDSISYGAYFAAFEASRGAFAAALEGLGDRASVEPAAGPTAPPLLATFLAGSVAGVACWVASYPADVVKTRMQGESPAARDPGAVAVARAILRQEGWRAFFAGLRATVCRAAVANAVIFSVYEGAHAALGGRAA